MKNILTGNEAIEAYERLQASYSSENIPRVCGYFTSDDYMGTNNYDSGTIVAFDNIHGGPYEDVFSSVNDAIEWIER